MSTTGYPCLSLFSIHSIQREDNKHQNYDGTFWTCTRLSFMDQQGITLLTVILYGDTNISQGPEIKSKPMRDSII